MRHASGAVQEAAHRAAPGLQSATKRGPISTARRTARSSVLRRASCTCCTKLCPFGVTALRAGGALGGRSQGSGGAGRTVRAPCIFFILIIYQTPLSYFVIAW